MEKPYDNGAWGGKEDIYSEMSDKKSLVVIIPQRV